ncbi:hypothetical protein [Nocardioides mangrovi]|uniref:Uncharacterized protein n=1 Tax=Nocardioides mangrovi TaxID=2874580 RepID=A0ABS7UIP4_9ACTN|nr:hypothetical protein [Nocardioides mangrovi]MBZ5740660.1 hypothetical protein [Nocardioides mangrovi]
MLFKKSRASASAVDQFGGVVHPSWEYLSLDSELVKSLLVGARAAARQGQPDPILGTSAPEVFVRSNATFAQLAESVRQQAVTDCAEDVAFLVNHAAEFIEARKAGSRGQEVLDLERSSRLQAEFGVCLGRLSAREEQHRAELGKLQSAARTTTALLKSAWEDKHPHPDHLGHFAIPEFELPGDAADIGQRAVESALSRHTETSPFNSNEKE